VTFFAAVTNCFEKYASFRGRASRSEYWYFVLFCFLGGLLLGVLEKFDDRLGIATLIFNFGTFLPSLAVGARRLHDTDRSGWWLLLWLLPIIGWLILIIWACIAGTDGPNRFGDPDDGSLADDMPAPGRMAPAGAQGWPPRASTGPRSEFGRRQYQR